MDYEEFIKSKEFKHVSSGFECGDLPYPLFDYQEPIVKWALRRGKAAVFADTGLGKTIMQLAWADQVAKRTGCPVIILAPLAVSNQTIKEGEKYGIDVSKAIPGAPMFGPHIVITNYEQLHKFDPDYFKGIVLDESSILKGMDGRRRKEITEFGSGISYRLSCTATPSPNDFMEIGTQSEFLGIMSQMEMLAMFFIHDGSDTSKWRLKGHGQRKFFEWMATWAVVIRSPEDLGFDGSRHKLPPVEYHSHVIETDPDGSLFVEPAQGLQERNKARKDSVSRRVAKAAEIANSLDGPVLVWCNLNDESERLAELIDDSVEVKGSDTPEHKVDAMLWFLGYDDLVLTSNGKIKKAAPCQTQNTSENTISKTESKRLRPPQSGNQTTERIEKNTCESMSKVTGANSEEPLSSKKNTTGSGESGTPAIKSIGSEQYQKSQITTQQTQTNDSSSESENTGSSQKTTGGCLKSREEGALYADALTLDAQKKKGSTLTTAMIQEGSEDYFAPTAIKASENSTTIQKDSGEPQNTLERTLISKPRIFGYGLNLQHCHQMIFVGLSDSWESYYQAIRRCWRFGQTEVVQVHIISADTEGAVVENIRRKDAQNNELGAEMVKHMKTMMEKEIFSASIEKTEYNAKQEMRVPQWLA